LVNSVAFSPGGSRTPINYTANSTKCPVDSEPTIKRILPRDFAVTTVG
jgi:hypothetical protein